MSSWNMMKRSRSLSAIFVSAVFVLILLTQTARYSLIRVLPIQNSNETRDLTDRTATRSKVWQPAENVKVGTQLERQVRLFHRKPLVIWCMDHHPAPPLDVRHLVEPLGVQLLQNDLSSRCQYFNLCEARLKLKIMTNENMFHMDHSLIPLFYEAYKNDSVMNAVDAFLCFDPPAICELYEPFNKSLIIVPSNRYYIDRTREETWRKWTNNLMRYASSPKNVIGANNLYDLNFLRYFTGIEPVLLQSFTGDYTGTMYNPTRPGFLIAKRRPRPEFIAEFRKDYANACNNQSNLTGCPTLTPISELYSNYKYSDIAAHQGIVHLPYQVSTMSIFEQYRMNIPLFFPSKQMLIDWDLHRQVLEERIGPRLVSMSGKNSFQPPPHLSQKHVPNPNDNNKEALSFWINFADFYRFPHIIYFDSAGHLAALLRNLTTEALWVISENMKEYNVKNREKILANWKTVLMTVAKYSPNHPH